MFKLGETVTNRTTGEMGVVRMEGVTYDHTTPVPVVVVDFPSGLVRFFGVEVNRLA